MFVCLCSSIMSSTFNETTPEVKDAEDEYLYHAGDRELHEILDGVCDCPFPDLCAEGLREFWRHYHAVTVPEDIRLLRQLGCPNDERAAACIAASPRDFRAAVRTMLIGQSAAGLAANRAALTANTSSM
jgi:hypothetical protein